jgi:hypothetical protein
MPKVAGPIDKCPKCGAAVEDIRARKKSDKSPDFRCTSCMDGEYKTAFWIEAPRAVRSTNGRAPSEPKWTWTTLGATYQRSVLIGKQVLAKLVPNATSADILAASATVFIAATRDGVKPDPQPVAEKSESLNERPRAFATKDADEDIPF